MPEKKSPPTVQQTAIGDGNVLIVGDQNVVNQTITQRIINVFRGDTEAQRANLIAIYPELEQAYPVRFVIIYGLVFTMILVLVYIPTHLSLSEAGRKLRDTLCPINSLSTLNDVLEKRNSLDEILQTNIGVMQNLRSGIVTLALLMSSLIVSLLGINIF